MMVEIIAKNGLPMDAQIHKMMTNRQTKHENKSSHPTTCAWKWRNKVKHKPSKAWFLSTLLHGIAVSTFPHLLRMCSKWCPKPFEIEVCGCLWRQKLVGERFKKHTKNQHQKSKKICQKCAPKRYPEKWSFCGFSGPGAKGVPGWSQRPPPSSLQGQIWSKFVQKRVREIGFLWCFIIRSCPRLNPHAPKCFRDVSR